ncbi:MAG TPA: ATP-binding protein [Polyangiaceae bacterium]|nr:ATP-binding protein [Polyangiaceae bacterium]
MSPRRESRLERGLMLLGLLGPLPALLVAGWLAGLPQSTSEWLAASSALTLWLWAALAIRARVARALASISSLLAALRQGDFSVRGHSSGGSDGFGAALGEINGLAECLAQQRTGALEATALLSKVMGEIDVAVFAFDRARRLKLVNRAGERLISNVSPPGLGTAAADMGLLELLDGPTPRTVDMTFAGGPGQWELRRSTFRLEGLPHELIVLSDLRRALREEERQAWQRIIRVIGHEINNSLAPIRSIAGDLQQMLLAPATERHADFEDDLARGLAVIDRRSAGLDRFMTSYARLAKLPPPRLGPVDVDAWVRRVVELERRLPVRLARGPSLTIQGDGDQLDQLLINLVRNGVDAAVETGGGVEVSWQTLGARQVEITVADEGQGVADTHNLFVPFFTTKPGGTGIGLVLSRQICEAHRGSLTLEPRPDRRGALARLLLPL